jgi:molybdopterin synthase sulfur carrier subunit
MRPSTTLLYFAWVRERIGTGEESVDLPGDIADLAGLIAWLRARSPGHEAAFAGPGLVRAAVNQVFARSETPVAPGDEVAFFPPVTGG